jgi:hypothetical protein
MLTEQDIRVGTGVSWLSVWPRDESCEKCDKTLRFIRTCNVLTANQRPSMMWLWRFSMSRMAHRVASYQPAFRRINIHGLSLKYIYILKGLWLLIPGKTRDLPWRWRQHIPSKHW